MIAVAAALILKDGKLLAAHRPNGSHLAGYWEFPGGKLEPGEMPEEALMREIEEELGAKVCCGRIYAAIPYSYPEKDVLLMFYPCVLREDEPKPIEEAEIRYITEKELADMQWAPVDALLAQRLIADGFGFLSSLMPENDR